MKTVLLIALLLLSGCQKKPTADDAYPNLPRTGRMIDKGDIKAPQATKEFCAAHPDFEKC